MTTYTVYRYYAWRHLRPQLAKVTDTNEYPRARAMAEDILDRDPLAMIAIIETDAQTHRTESIESIQRKFGRTVTRKNYPPTL